MITYKLAIPGQGTHVTLKGVALIGLGIAAANRYMEVARSAGRTDIAIVPEQLREEKATVTPRRARAPARAPRRGESDEEERQHLRRVAPDTYARLREVDRRYD